MFTITVTENARIDLGFFKKAERTAILDTLARQLGTEPLKPTRNRKTLDPNVLGRWELRVGDVPSLL